MNLKRCNNGHFYDADKFSTCPHCNMTASVDEETVALDMGKFGQVDDEGPTVALQEDVSVFADSIPESTINEEKTVSFYKGTLGTDPVVGWLVCTEGEYYGRSFPLKSGRNFIGRSQDMDVCLSGDLSVSRERHAIVIYEPKTRIFIAQAGDSHELFYLNDKVVLNNEALSAYDVLTVGNEKLIFIPLCGDKFCWEDTKKEGE